ncbi:MAG: type II 3-dehydroquinate dehydratase, partial [Gammaproteobacteria bacterium]|nr:type II 3-dehydroquinate dehydratase [Gammaproteobacteria bacterium]
MSKKVHILNGPNLNLLGKREPDIYGDTTLADVEAECRSLATSLGLEIEFSQSNAEHMLIDWIQQARETMDGIIINPAAFTHTSIAILDALNVSQKVLRSSAIKKGISGVHERVRSGSSLNDAMSDEEFSRDQYVIKNRARSILCTPLL